jgi:hypothetical protein
LALSRELLLRQLAVSHRVRLLKDISKWFLLLLSRGLRGGTLPKHGHKGQMAARTAQDEEN